MYFKWERDIPMRFFIMSMPAIAILMVLSFSMQRKQDQLASDGGIHPEVPASYLQYLRETTKMHAAKKRKVIADQAAFTTISKDSSG
jgi:hypothetical protein